jgi:hypothetical protein
MSLFGTIYQSRIILLPEFKDKFTIILTDLCKKITKLHNRLQENSPFFWILVILLILQVQQRKTIFIIIIIIIPTKVKIINNTNLHKSICKHCLEETDLNYIWNNNRRNSKIKKKRNNVNTIITENHIEWKKSCIKSMINKMNSNKTYPQGVWSTWISTLSKIK